jgi:hypothetical protein
MAAAASEKRREKEEKRQAEGKRKGNEKDEGREELKSSTRERREGGRHFPSARQTGINPNERRAKYSESARK